MLENKMNDAKTNEFLDYIHHLSYNKKCADCGKSDPSWVSMNFAFFICYECSSLHRGLGSSITKVKSILMDHWSEDELRRIYIGGNKNIHKLDDSLDFQSKYKNSNDFIKELNRLFDENKKREPNDKFMNYKKESKIAIGKANVVKQNKKKFSDDFSTSSEEIATPEIKNVKQKQKEKEIFEIKVENEEKVLERTSKSTGNLKKSINPSRSPFSFTVSEIEKTDE